MYIFNKIKSMYCIMNNLSHILTYCMGKENYTTVYCKYVRIERCMQRAKNG